MIEINGVFTLLGVIITAIISQTIAVWVRFGNLEKKITENKCPFGECPLYARAKVEAMPIRSVKETGEEDHIEVVTDRSLG